MAEPERTPDGHHIVINGRRWRATDPGIPEAFRAELVRELMAARRAVKDAENSDGEAAARARVQDAKVALGERGHPWWDEPTDQQFADRAAATIRVLLRARSADSSICPSDVARAVGGPGWRDRMDDVRAVAQDLAADGSVRLTQGDKAVASLAEAVGPIRIRRGRTGTDPENGTLDH